VQLPFIKIEGLGNDYIYVDRQSLPHNKPGLPALTRLICDRHRGVGADGLIVMEKTDPASALMAIYNCDGSRAEFCGNGLRGTALYLESVSRAKNKKYAISTRWCDYEVEIIKLHGNKATVRATLGGPSFAAEDIGYRGKEKTCLGITVDIEGRPRSIYCVAMPNPHAVIFVDNFEFDWQKAGKTLEKSRVFKRGINVMFAKVNSRSRLIVKPWERGAGATMACGSVAAAATVVSCLLEYTGGNVTSVMPGGSLNTRWNIAENKVYQEGPTRIVFAGSYIV
jgi:diaminopimelate epimerase